MDGADSVTSFVVLDRFCHQEAPFSLLKVFPRTGRKHQIRIHLSHAGYPIVGDKIYGIVPDAYLSVCFGELTAEQAHRLIFDNHALHASGLALSLADDSVEMQAPINPKMLDFCVKGGVSADLFPLEPKVEAAFEDRFIEAVCNHLDAVQRAKRSN
jgi:23S rRNA pseudouridine1911/1915/1917 synthase